MSTGMQQNRKSLEMLLLTTPAGARAEVYLYGAHLTRWHSSSGKDWIFLSEDAQYEAGKSIRGGVPVIFPQFSGFGNGPRHGFARDRFWELKDAPTLNGDTAHCAMVLHADANTRALWPHDFCATMSFDLSDHGLCLTLDILNTGNHPFTFSGALHSYFKVADFSQSRLCGLENLSYWDNDGTDFAQRQHQHDDELQFADAIDRVYFDCKEPLQLVDSSQRSLSISTEGFSEVVVWNPGEAATRLLPDMADHEYRKMVCVEAAQIDHPVTLAPGEAWVGRQRLEER